MNKHYRLIVQNDFSLANETDADPQSDYSPGIWAIGSQKRALELSKRLLAEGDTIEVTCYSNPRFYALANKFIKELGLSQELFKEPEAIKTSVVTKAGAPKSLADLKRWFQNSKDQFKIVRYTGEGEIKNERFTKVRRVQSNAVVVEKSLEIPGHDSWLEFGKASEWSFDNEGATLYSISREGAQVPCVRIVY